MWHDRRATAIAIMLFVGYLLGLGIGSVITGALSDYFSATDGPAGLRYGLLIAMALTAPAALIRASAAPMTGRDIKD